MNKQQIKLFREICRQYSVKSTDLIEELYNIERNIWAKNMNKPTRDKDLYVNVALGYLSHELKSTQKQDPLTQIITQLEPKINCMETQINKFEESIHNKNSKEIDYYSQQIQNLAKNQLNKITIGARRLQDQKINARALFHDLKSPLATTTVILRLFSDSNNTQEDISTYIAGLKNNIQYQRAIIEKTRNTQIIGQELYSIHPENLTDILLPLETRIKILAGRKQLQVTTNYEHDINTKINTDKTYISRILDNLATNAIKYTDTGFIEIGTKTENGDIQIYIKDTGRGIPPEDIVKIFDKDYKATNYKESEVMKSEGLGLNIAQEYAHKLKGNITLETELNKGSTFYLTMPKNFN